MKCARRNTPRDRIKTAGDELVCFVAGRLAEGLSCPKIAALARQRFRLEWLTREQVYPLFAEAVRRGLIMICPPKDVYLGQRLFDRLEDDSVAVRRRIHVVRSDELDSVATVMAEVLSAQIDILRNDSGLTVVNLALGSGELVRLAIKQLAGLLRAKAALPVHFVLHPLVTMRSGFPPLGCLGYLDSGVNTAAMASTADNMGTTDVTCLQAWESDTDEQPVGPPDRLRQSEAAIVLGANGLEPAMLWKFVGSWPWHDLVLSGADAQALLEHPGSGRADCVWTAGP